MERKKEGGGLYMLNQGGGRKIRDRNRKAATKGRHEQEDLGMTNLRLDRRVDYWGKKKGK